MKVIKGLATYYDIDETLVYWDEINYTIDDRYVNAMIRHKERGHVNIVWSAGGAEWAASVVKEFQIGYLVDAVISKPSWFYDDKKAEEFMPEINRVYYGPMEQLEFEFPVSGTAFTLLKPDSTKTCVDCDCGKAGGC